MDGTDRRRGFLAAGAVLFSGGGGRLAKTLSALGVAAAVTVIPWPVGDAALPAHERPAPAEAGTSAGTPSYGLSRIRSRIAEAISPAGIAARLPDWQELQAVIEHRQALSEKVHEFEGGWKVPHPVLEDIVRAARDTGFPADLLMAIAEKESGFRCEDRPSRGTAAGCFQFIEQTWLSMVREHGAEFGLAREAAAVEARLDRRRRTVLRVADPKEQERILALRDDVYLSAVMTVRNFQAARDRIDEAISVVLSEEDFYLPHFMGTNGAQRLIRASMKTPGASAARTFPRAASFNRNMFGRLTVAQFHERTREVVTDRRGKYEGVEKIAETGYDFRHVPPIPVFRDDRHVPQGAEMTAGLRP